MSLKDERGQVKTWVSVVRVCFYALINLELQVEVEVLKNFGGGGDSCVHEQAKKLKAVPRVIEEGVSKFEKKLGKEGNGKK